MEVESPTLKITLYQMALFFCKRHTPPLGMKSNGVKIFYSHGTTNSCGVAIAFLGSKSLEVVESKNND